MSCFMLDIFWCVFDLCEFYLVICDLEDYDVNYFMISFLVYLVYMDFVEFFERVYEVILEILYLG